MKKNNFFLPETNYIIVSKQGLNSTKNSRGNNLSKLTFKEGNHSVKINLNSSQENKINKDNIIQTITDYRKKINILQKHQNKNNLYQYNKTSIKENNKKKYKVKLLEEKVLSSYNSIDAINAPNKLEKINISNNNSENENNKTSDKNIIKEKNTPEPTQLIAKNPYSLELENTKDIQDKENEDNFASSINKKSVKTLQFKKEIQKTKQISDKAEISKVNSESDNNTEFDYKLKSSMKLKKIKDNNNGDFIMTGIIGPNINEKEELENEIIDADKDLITVLNNNSNINADLKSFRSKEIDKNILKTNNYFNKKEKSIEKESIIENSDGLIDKSIKKNDSTIKENEKQKVVNNLEDIDKKNEDNLIDENFSSNKKLIPILKRNNQNFLQLIPTKEINRNIDGNESPTRKKQVTLNVKEVNKDSNNTKEAARNLLLNQNLNQNSSINVNISGNSHRVFYKSYENIQKDCYICEKPFYFIKLYYADCGIHFLCRKCLKSYYEDYIENKLFSKTLKCPCAQCEKNIDYEKIVKEIISETHQKIYDNFIENKWIEDSEREKDYTMDNDLKLYTKKHVLDVNNNKNIYMFKKTKDRYCPRCLRPYLFSKTNNNFIKCLFCNLKICKYCFKEFNSKHLNLQNEDHCKIRYRRRPDEPEQKSCITNYLLELFFVIAIYILLFPSIFLSFLNIFNKCLKVNNNNKNTSYYIKSCISLFFGIIFFIICIPFIILIYSMFPAFNAIFDW